MTISELSNPVLYEAIIKAAVNDTIGSTLEVRQKQTNSNSFYLQMERRRVDFGIKKKKKCELTMGIGLQEITYNPGLDDDGQEPVTIKVLHSNINVPTCSVRGDLKIVRQLVLFVMGRNRSKFFKEFCTYVFEKAREKHDKLITIYRWTCQGCWWRKVGTKMPRSMESVVLPIKTKNLVHEDLRDFLSNQTEEFYNKHGIPYKRSYLFRGLPGTGKTSFIEALAGVHKRNLCQMVLAVPKMTDDMFAECISNVPSESIIMLEDVDALFDSGREGKKVCPLTFSAVLNGLDGIASPYAQIFIMTTNYPNRLDPALVRSGRVDVHIEFKNATKLQMEAIFLNFYPEAKDEAKQFADNVCKLGKYSLSMAALQQHFVRHTSDTAQDTLMAVEEIKEFAFMESQSCALKNDSVYN